MALLAALAPARADKNDLVLSRLGTVTSDGSDVLGDNVAFRSLASELGVVLAPRLLTPADTLGFGGFQFAADVAVTGISSDRPYWRALASSPDPLNPTARHGEDFMTTVGLFARKGIWLPLPSFEVGAGVVRLLDSQMWAAQLYAKFALHEGYHDLPLPSFAVRGAASRAMGSAQLDLTVASIDGSLSKDLGIAGTMTLSPYAGWGVLVIVARSEVIDKTPHIDSLAVPSDVTNNFVFVTQDNILRQRGFFGLKARYYVLAVTLEGAIGLAGRSVDDRANTNQRCRDAIAPTTMCDATDEAQMQQTYTISVGLDF